MPKIKKIKKGRNGYAFIYDCPNCAHELISPEQDVGGYDNCPECNQNFVVPGEAELDLIKQKQIEEVQSNSIQNPPETHVSQPVQATNYVENLKKTISQVRHELEQKAAPVGEVYVYKMIRIAPNLSVTQNSKVDHGTLVAKYLENHINKFSVSGWEFFRIDTFNVHELPGCWLFGESPTGKTTSHYVVTLRRKISGDRFRQMKIAAFSIQTPYVGLAYDYDKPSDSVKILTVEPDSPGAKAGIKNGDIIIAVDGLMIRETSDVKILITTKIPGDSISMTILRDERTIEFNIVLGTKTE